MCPRKRNEHLDPAQQRTVLTCTPSLLAITFLNPAFVDPRSAFSEFDPRKHIARYLRFENGEGETIALAGKDESKEFQQWKTCDCCHQPYLVLQRAQAHPRNSEAVEEQKTVAPPRSKTGDGLFDLSFRPSINEVWNFSVFHSPKGTVVPGKARYLIVLSEIQNPRKARYNAVTWFEDQEAVVCYAICLCQRTMRRLTVMQSVVNDAEIEFIIFECEVFSILETPGKRRKLLAFYARIEIRDRDVAKAGLFECPPVLFSAADYEDFHALMHETVPYQTLERADIEDIHEHRHGSRKCFGRCGQVFLDRAASPFGIRVLLRLDTAIKCDTQPYYAGK